MLGVRHSRQWRKDWNNLDVGLKECKPMRQVLKRNNLLLKQGWLWILESNLWWKIHDFFTRGSFKEDELQLPTGNIAMVGQRRELEIFVMISVNEDIHRSLYCPWVPTEIAEAVVRCHRLLGSSRWLSQNVNLVSNKKGVFNTWKLIKELSW